MTSSGHYVNFDGHTKENDPEGDRTVPSCTFQRISDLTSRSRRFMFQGFSDSVWKDSFINVLCKDITGLLKLYLNLLKCDYLKKKNFGNYRITFRHDITFL